MRAQVARWVRTPPALGVCLFLVFQVLAHAYASAGSGAVTTVAGTSVAGYLGDGGLGTAAQLHSPSGVASGSAGDILVADTENHAVRVLEPSGILRTLAGDGVPGNVGDRGPAALARLNGPGGVAVRPNGVVLIADTGNHVIRRIDGDGVIVRVAGTGFPGYAGDGGPATAADLNQPQGVAVRPNGLVYVADTGNDVVRRLELDGSITTVAGTGVPGYAGDGRSAASAKLDAPAGVAVTPNGTLYIADTGNHVVRRVDVHGTISTVAGTGSPGYGGDEGPASEAQLRSPTAVAVAPDGDLLIADSGNHVVRRVDRHGTITTVAGTGSPGYGGDGGPATAAQFSQPTGVAVGDDGDVYIADTGNHRLRRIQGRPAAPVVTAISPSSPANENLPLLRGDADPGTTVTVYADADCSTVLGSGPADQFASPGLQVPVADDTTSTLYASATDDAGGVSPCSTTSATYVEDSTAPPPPVITPPATSDGGGTSLSWSFEAESGSTTGCRLLRDGVPVASRGGCASPWKVDIGGRPEGAYTLEVRAVDAAGNASPTAAASYLPRPAPADPGAPVSSAGETSSEGSAGGQAAPGADGAGAPLQAVATSPPVATPPPAATPPAAPATPGPSDRRSAPLGSSTDAGSPESGGAARRPATGAAPQPEGSLPGVLRTVTRAAVASLDETAFPMVLLLVVLAFLAIQDQIDRRDPKLALAPVHDDPEQDFTDQPAAARVWTSRRTTGQEQFHV